MNKKYLLAAMFAATSAHAEEMEEIVVTHPLAGDGVSQSISILEGNELVESAAATLGETVAEIAGIRNASFGPAAGRPVIHGLSGPRIKTTQDRIDSLDVSVTSTDHAVTVEPFIADQVVILKGPSVLLYGSGAIGGVVDTVTGRVPRSLPEKPIDGRAELRFTDNADAQVGAVRLDGAAGKSIAWHVDAFSKDAEDYDIPGTTASSALIATQGEEEELVSGTLPNSFFDSQGVAGGLSWIGENGFFGASISTTEGVYGLVGPGEDEEEEEGEEGEEFAEFEGEEEEEGGAFIDLEQVRLDLEGELRLESSFINSINFRFGFNDYEHTEFEAPGEAGTVFDNEAWEGRLQFTHGPAILGFSGTSGIQLSDRDFSAIGEEAFVPPVDTQTVGTFWVGQRDFGKLSLELGSRLDFVDHEAEGFEGEDFSFTNSSASAGIVYQSTDQTQFSALFDITERAPNPEELFSNGPHIATQTFDIGDPTLDEETAFSLNLGWAYNTETFNASISLYHNNFSDFIFQTNTLEIEDGFPVLQYVQQDADFTGVDIQGGVQIAEVAGGGLDFLLTFDAVSVDLDNDDELPRIPSERIGLALDFQNSGYQAKLSFTSQASQDEVAVGELPTESYTDVSIFLNRKWDLNGSDLVLFLHGKNLGDEDQREHVSFVKDFAPLPGRRIEAGVRFNF